LLLLWLSDLPVAVKVVVTAILVVGAGFIVAFYLGRRYEWKKSK
jgi:uncharacterized membrane protein (Fun14 family)